MTKDEYRAAIAAVGLTQVGASVFFGVDRKTSPRWARGEWRVPVAVALLLRLMLRCQLSAADVTRMASQKEAPAHEKPVRRRPDRAAIPRTDGDPRARPR